PEETSSINTTTPAIELAPPVRFRLNEKSVEDKPVLNVDCFSAANTSASPDRANSISPVPLPTCTVPLAADNIKSPDELVKMLGSVMPTPDEFKTMPPLVDSFAPK